MSSLTLVYTIGVQIIEAIQMHERVSKKEARQRAMIAMALSCKPRLLISDVSKKGPVPILFT